MAWFDYLNLPGSTITGHFAFVREDGPDVDDAPDLQLASGTVTFRPTAPAVRAGGAWVGISPVTAVIFDGELVVAEEDPRPLRLLSTDADTGVEGWGWEAAFDIDGAAIKPIRFRAPIEGAHLTGDDLIPITGNPVEVIYAGRPGKSAYEYALDAGFEGTEEEFAQAQLPDEVSWANVTEKPDVFLPSAHEHNIEQVNGLDAALGAKANINDLVTVIRTVPGVFTIGGGAA